MQQETVQPIQNSKRTAIVDILRGWAILGVAIGNYSDYSFFGRPVKLPPNIASNILQGVHQAFFAAKSWTMLSVLFGYGFAIVMNNVAAKGKNPVAFFTRRMFWLLVIAFVNSAFWFGDILKDYAFMGLILLFFYKSSAKTTFRLGVFLLLILPFVTAWVAYALPYNYQAAVRNYYLPQLYSHNWIEMFKAQLKGTYYLQMISPSYAINVHIMIFACMLFGFAAQRTDIFNRLPELKKQLKTVFWISLAATVITNVGIGMLFMFKSPVLTYFKPFQWAVFSTMMMILSGICWLYTAGKLKRFFAGMQAMGKMTLTNYMVQNIVAVFIFLNVGFGVFNTMPYWFYFVTAVAIFTIQIFISKWWLTYYNYGPIEWVWRQLSYAKRLPIKKVRE
jgi:uncharacterized protein